MRGAGKSANFCEVSDTSLRNRKICKIAERPRHVEGCVGSPHCGLWPRARGVAGHEGLGVAEGEFTKGVTLCARPGGSSFPNLTVPWTRS